MEEIKVYGILTDDLSSDFDENLVVDDELTNEQWVEISEEQDLVYGLNEFALLFNKDYINNFMYIRFIKDSEKKDC